MSTPSPVRARCHGCMTKQCYDRRACTARATICCRRAQPTTVQCSYVQRAFSGVSVVGHGNLLMKIAVCWTQDAWPRPSPRWGTDYQPLSCRVKPHKCSSSLLITITVTAMQQNLNAFTPASLPLLLAALLPLH